ncbi:hypothetical protein HYV81_06235 [Candidatus Woesearchaeota archaeon]|nr:hypothetical protein [Candidatus Woesearchaeota archaeon]
MSFVRIKKIKGNEYAYTVENRWKGKGSRQKVIGYLGRVHRVAEAKELNFFEFFEVDDKEAYLKKVQKEELTSNIVRLELVKHGFTGEKVLQHNGLTVDLGALQVRQGKRKAAIAMHDGFLADTTLRGLVGFKEIGSQAELSVKLAKAFVEAGIKVDEELFVAVYEKVTGK